MDLHELIAFIESHYGIKIEDLEVLPENFTTLNALIAYIERELASRLTRATEHLDPLSQRACPPGEPDG